MSNPPTPLPNQRDEEIVERLATEVMGWHNVKARGFENVQTRIWATHNRDQNEHWDFAADIDWNPLKDWNHWRQVEEKVMEGEGNVLFMRYIRNICPYEVITTCTKADLPTRCKAILLALDSLK